MYMDFKNRFLTRDIIKKDRKTERQKERINQEENARPRFIPETTNTRSNNLAEIQTAATVRPYGKIPF